MVICDICGIKENVKVDLHINIEVYPKHTSIVIKGVEHMIKYDACGDCHNKMVSRVNKIVRDITFESLKDDK